MNDLSDGLRTLLSRDPAAVRKWSAGVFDELTGDKGNRLVLCGAGGLGRRTLAGLRRLGLEPLAFADFNPALAGQTVDGLQVYSPADAARAFGRDSTFVVTIWGAHGRDRLADRKRQWSSLGCDPVVSFRALYWKQPETFLPHYTCDLPHKVYESSTMIQSVAGLWSDPFSREEFQRQLRWRTELDFDGLIEPVAGPAYFPADLIGLHSDERFLDGGAFDGDTLMQFLSFKDRGFERYWACEPDPENFGRLAALVSGLEPALRNRIRLFPFALGEREERLRFAAAATAGSAISPEGTIEVECRRLDDLLTSDRPTFIKLDIEGAELSALAGARRLLETARPIVAVSVYHLQEHLWEIPAWLAIHLTDYEYHLRPHDREGWDLVCYAIPHERSVSRAKA